MLLAVPHHLDPPPRRRRGPASAGPLLLAVAFAGLAACAVLGPSAAEAPLGRHDNAATPPWHLGSAAPTPWLVTGLLALSILSGVATLTLVLSGRWHPDPRRLLVSGILAAASLSMLAPIGSADPLSYAAYGRMVATGLDPYTTTPNQLAARGDPVGAAVEVPWKDTPSVYGPVASAEQGLASTLAGGDVALTVLVLDLVGGAAFVAVGLLLHRVARDDTERRRAGVFWTANPLLWLQLLAGAHLDVVAAGFAVAAVVAATRSRLAAGILAGVAMSIKAPLGLVWLALLWAGRRSRRALVELGLSAVVIAGVGYVVAGSAAIHQLRRASTLVSFGTPWRPLIDLTDPAFGHGTSRRLVGILAALLLVGLVAAIARLHPQVREGNPAAVAFALLLAYVLAAPYALPWYDAAAWALLPLVAASRLDGLLLAHTGVLSLAYIPGRAAIRLHGVLHAATAGMRSGVSPVVVGLLIVSLLGLGVWRPSRHPRVPAPTKVC